jgi:DNA-binding NarL/FixJ family response regulator
LNVTYCQYPRRHRALIVEDELLIALNLEAEMNALGFNICILAPRANKACPLAMSDHPDIVLMDLYDGVREGIEAAKRLREEHAACVPNFIHGLIERRADTSTPSSSSHSAESGLHTASLPMP